MDAEQGRCFGKNRALKNADDDGLPPAKRKQKIRAATATAYVYANDISLDSINGNGTENKN